MYYQNLTFPKIQSWMLIGCSRAKIHNIVTSTCFVSVHCSTIKHKLTWLVLSYRVQLLLVTFWLAELERDRMGVTISSPVAVLNAKSSLNGSEVLLIRQVFCCHIPVWKWSSPPGGRSRWGCVAGGAWGICIPSCDRAMLASEGWRWG